MNRVAVPFDQFAKLQTGDALADVIDKTREMNAHDFNAHFERRLGTGFAAQRPVSEPAEEKRVGQKHSANRNRRAAGVNEHPSGVGDRADVAVADDRQAIDRLEPRRECRRDLPGR